MGGVEPWLMPLMARWKPVYDFLFVIIEPFSLALTRQNVSRLAAIRRRQVSLNRYFREGVVPGEYLLVSTKLDTFCYLTVQTAPCYVPSF